jgi:hypothetical protein
MNFDEGLSQKNVYSGQQRWINKNKLMSNDRRTLTGRFLEQLDHSDPDGEDVKPFERL